MQTQHQPTVYESDLTLRETVAISKPRETSPKVPDVGSVVTSVEPADYRLTSTAEICPTSSSSYRQDDWASAEADEEFWSSDRLPDTDHSPGQQSATTKHDDHFRKYPLANSDTGAVEDEEVVEEEAQPSDSCSILSGLRIVFHSDV